MNETDRPRRTKWSYGILALLVSVIFIVWLIQTLTFAWPFGFDQEIEDGSIVLTEVRPESPAFKAGLIKGDILVEWGGYIITEENQHDIVWIVRKEKRIVEGQAVPIVVEREGEIVHLSAMPEKANRFDFDRIHTVVHFLLFVSIGMFVIFRKPEFGPGRLFAYICLAVAVYFSFIINMPHLFTLFDLIRCFVFHVSYFMFPMLLHFSLIYPEKKKMVKKHPNILKWIYAPYVLFLLYEVVNKLYIYLFQEIRWFKPWVLLLEWNATPRLILELVVTLLAVACFVYSFFRASTDLNKRRMRWLLGGILIGVLPVFLLNVAALIFGEAITHYAVLDRISMICIFAAPIAIARSIMLEERPQAVE